MAKRKGRRESPTSRAMTAMQEAAFARSGPDYRKKLKLVKLPKELRLELTDAEIRQFNQLDERGKAAFIKSARSRIFGQDAAPSKFVRSEIRDPEVTEAAYKQISSKPLTGSYTQQSGREEQKPKRVPRVFVPKLKNRRK